MRGPLHYPSSPLTEEMALVEICVVCEVAASYYLCRGRCWCGSDKCLVKLSLDSGWIEHMKYCIQSTCLAARLA